MQSLAKSSDLANGRRPSGANAISVPLLDVPGFCFVASFSTGGSVTRARFGTVVECDDKDLRGLPKELLIESLNKECCKLETSLIESAGDGDRGSDESLLRFRLTESLVPDGLNSGVVCFLGDFSVAEEGVLLASRAGAFLAVPFLVVNSFLVSKRRRGVGPRDALCRDAL